MSEYNPALGRAPEAQAMMATGMAALSEWRKEHYCDNPYELRCGFGTISTCALPIVLEEKDVAPNPTLPPMLFNIPVTIDPSVPYGEFRFSGTDRITAWSSRETNDAD